MGGPEGATAYPVSPGEHWFLQNRLLEAEDNRWLQSGSPQCLAGTAGSQDGRSVAEAETATPARGWVSRDRASSTICAAFWRRRNPYKMDPLASHVQRPALS